MRRHHDMGGEPAGPVERVEHDYALWEKRVDAILRLLVSPQCKVMTVDELRRGVEQLGPAPTTSSPTTSAGSPRSATICSRRA